LRECIGIPAKRYFPRPILVGFDKVPKTISRDFETVGTVKKKIVIDLHVRELKVLWFL